MEAAGSELGFAAAEIVPVRVDGMAAPYNVDALWAKIIELVPEAQRARLLRTLSDIKSAPRLGGDLVAGGQRWPRHQGHLPEPELHAMTQIKKPATEGGQRASPSPRRRPEREPTGDDLSPNGRRAAAAALAGFDPWARASHVALIGLFVIALLWCAYVAQPVIVPVLLAWVIATIVLPIVKWHGAAQDPARGRGDTA